MIKLFYYFYKILYKFKLTVPKFIARYVASHLVEFNLDNEIRICTSDLSKQVVHPDYIKFNGENILSITPYPFGIDVYENPELYIEKDGIFKAMDGFLKFKPQSVGVDHYSDPVMFVSEGKIHICLRWTNKVEKLNRLYITSSKDLKTWKTPKLVLEEHEDFLMSPAISVMNDFYKMYTVDYNENDNIMKLRTSSNYIDWSEAKDVKVRNLPSNFRLWHIAIDHDNSEKGIFLIKNETDHKLMFSSKINDLEWVVQNEVILPENLKKEIQIVYKACFYTVNIILISAMFKDYSWRIVKVNIKGEV